MNDQAPAPQPTGPAGGFVVPTNSPEGQVLDARGQLATMMNNPDWARDALEAGTQSRGQLSDLNRRLARELDAGVADFEAPAASPEAYVIPFDTEAAGTTELVQAARTWMHAAGLGQQAGSSLVATVDELARKA